MRPMRTLQQLRADLADQNIQRIAALSGVNPKTIYRIRQRADYTPGVDKVEQISRALDQAKRGSKKAA